MHASNETRACRNVTDRCQRFHRQLGFAGRSHWLPHWWEGSRLVQG